MTMEQEEKLDRLLRQARELVAGERNRVANLANLSALLFESLDGLNWAGFYLADGKELVLGPFQGRPACIRIPWGKGVCGTAAARRETVAVPDVHSFPGHIACDSASRSELVVPLLDPAGNVLAVMDLDSPHLGRFGGGGAAQPQASPEQSCLEQTCLEQTCLEQVARLLEAACDWDGR